MTLREENAALLERAEQAEARLATISGMTRTELVAREENKRIDMQSALETCVAALKRVGCQDAGGCGMYEPDGLCFICAAIVKAEALR